MTAEPADAESRELVLRVIACDHIEYPRRVLYRAANRADTSVDADLDHALAAHQFFSRSDAH